MYRWDRSAISRVPIPSFGLPISQVARAHYHSHSPLFPWSLDIIPTPITMSNPLTDFLKLTNNSCNGVVAMLVRLIWLHAGKVIEGRQQSVGQV